MWADLEIEQHRRAIDPHLMKDRRSEILSG
jgi:hypothetical protein